MNLPFLMRSQALYMMCGLVCMVPVEATAQSNWAKVAVPSYSPAQVLQGLYQHWLAPRALEFAAEAQVLERSLQSYCAVVAPAGPDTARPDAVRLQWSATVQAWERLSTVAVGPLLERRSQRQIDFAPTRPALIERAINTGPVGAAAMERIGTPAKGFPALEWLLWTKIALPASSECRYAIEVARDIEREAQALQTAFKALSQKDWASESPESQTAGVGEWVNQWLGGLERLRWAQVDKPLRAAAATGRSAVQDWPRAASGGTARSWATQWQALRVLAIFAAPPDTASAPTPTNSTTNLAAPAPGQALVPLETYLRSKGRNAVADALVASARQADQGIPSLGARQQPSKSQVNSATRALALLKTTAQNQVAPALDVSLGFSDADGD